MSWFRKFIHWMTSCDCRICTGAKIEREKEKTKLHCPDCGGSEFFEGPYTNVFCVDCKQGFDYTPFGLRSIPRKWEGIEESAP